MNNKMIEEKYEEWNDGMDSEYSNVKPAFFAGYELAQKEMEERLKEAEEIICLLVDSHTDEAEYKGHLLAATYFKKWGVE